MADSAPAPTTAPTTLAEALRAAALLVAAADFRSFVRSEVRFRAWQEARGRCPAVTS